ncbi:MAG: hypothetical protein NVSMB64_29880 [Candidatus Velthaea sp.]
MRSVLRRRWTIVAPILALSSLAIVANARLLTVELHRHFFGLALIPALCVAVNVVSGMLLIRSQRYLERVTAERLEA